MPAMKRSSSEMSKSNDNAQTYDVFVGHLAPHCTKAMLKRIADEKGLEAVSAKILYKTNKTGMRNGFVIFASKESAEKFVNEFHGKTGVFGSADPLSVRFGDGKANTKLFFGNLEPSTTQEQLQEMAGKYGKLMTSRLLSRSGKKVCGFVVFSTPKEAAACLEGLNTPEHDFTIEYSKNGTKSKANRFHGRSSKRSRTSADSIQFGHYGSDMSSTSSFGYETFSPFQNQSPIYPADSIQFGHYGSDMSSTSSFGYETFSPFENQSPIYPTPGPLMQSHAFDQPPFVHQPTHPPMQQLNQLAQDEFGNWNVVDLNQQPIANHPPLFQPGHFGDYQQQQFIPAQC